MLRVIIILLALSATAFAERNEPAPVDAPYNKVFAPERACAEAEALAKRG
jgi:hypothetical protein